MIHSTSKLEQKILAKLRRYIYPNGSGDGKNTHLSVFVAVIKGEYYALLRWPFDKKVKLTLINQQDDPDQRENETGEIVAKIFSALQGPRRKKTKEKESVVSYLIWNFIRGATLWMTHYFFRLRLVHHLLQTPVLKFEKIYNVTFSIKF